VKEPADSLGDKIGVDVAEEEKQQTRQQALGRQQQRCKRLRHTPARFVQQDVRG
jgi:hypothetical protein